MAQSTTLPDVWSGEDVLFTMEIAGDATAVEIAGVVDPTTINITGGKKGGKGIPLGNGGRAWKQDPQEDITLEFDAYTRGINVENNTTELMMGFQQYFDGQTEDTSDPISSDVSRVQKKFRVSLLKTEDTTAVSASGAVATAKAGQRYAVANARMTKFEHTYSDNVWKMSVGFTIIPFKRDKTANVRWESTDGSSTTGMPAFSAFTDTTNF